MANDKKKRKRRKRRRYKYKNIIKLIISLIIFILCVVCCIYVNNLNVLPFKYFILFIGISLLVYLDSYIDINLNIFRI